MSGFGVIPTRGRRRPWRGRQSWAFWPVLLDNAVGAISERVEKVAGSPRRSTDRERARIPYRRQPVREELVVRIIAFSREASGSCGL